MMNAGYNRGFHVETGKTYRFSVYARRTKDFDQPVKISIESLTGTVLQKLKSQSIRRNGRNTLQK